MPIILLDMDNTTVDFDGGMRKYLKENCPWFMLQPEGRRYNFWFEYDYLLEQRPPIKAAYTSQGFFLNLPPVGGAIEAIWEMREEGLEVVFCSSPLQQNPWCPSEKRQWIDRNLDRTFPYITAEDKTRVKGDLMIDDCPDPLGDFEPMWKRVVFDRQYNHDVPGTRLYSWKNWREVLLPLLSSA